MLIKIYQDTLDEMHEMDRAKAIEEINAFEQKVHQDLIKRLDQIEMEMFVWGSWGVGMTRAH